MAKSDALASPAVLPPERRQRLIDAIFRTFGHSRFTQDSPLRPDVWMAYWERLAAGEKDPRVDLILTPTEGSPAGHVAVALEAVLAGAPGALQKTGAKREAIRRDCCIAYSRTTVQTSLTPAQALTAIIALSRWWHDRSLEAQETDKARDREDNLPCGARALQRVKEFHLTLSAQSLTVDDVIASQGGSFQFYRFAALASLTLMFRKDPRKAEDTARKLCSGTVALKTLLGRMEPDLKSALTLIDKAAALLAEFEANNPEMASGGRHPRIWTAAVNRMARNDVYLSRRTIKVDATQTLFRVNTTGIVWAVIDSGIDARHPAFLQRPAGAPDPAPAVAKGPDWPGLTRITRSFDLTFLRELQTFSDYPKAAPTLSSRTHGQDDATEAAQRNWAAFVEHKRKTHPAIIEQLRARRAAGHVIGWDILAPLVEIPHNAFYRAPRHDHGTHVAGILAGGWSGDDCPRFSDSDEPGMLGACPELRLVDIRAFDDQGVGREDTVIEAIELIRFLNRESNRLVIHGANLSLSVTHDVQAFGCGQTPVCIACNDLVRSGVVVVAAAGNSGHEGDAALGSHGHSTRDISITDPGNADLVITVGSTHRQSPFSYGVSYFSSRGPTADGRLKPDLVAPGEKIWGPVPLAADGTAPCKALDGTSMAAPHVSGVAALLMARNRELIGEPLRIKDILCRTATDLGRIPAFQGAGLIDALRALQSI